MFKKHIRQSITLLNLVSKAAFKLDSSLIGHEIQVVSRHSDANNGEGNRTDFWFDAIKLQRLY